MATAVASVCLQLIQKKLKMAVEDFPIEKKERKIF